jgi:hypothetical protein
MGLGLRVELGRARELQAGGTGVPPRRAEGRGCVQCSWPAGPNLRVMGYSSPVRRAVALTSEKSVNDGQERRRGCARLCEAAGAARGMGSICRGRPPVSPDQFRSHLADAGVAR